jgi:hypothetical protein
VHLLEGKEFVLIEMHGKTTIKITLSYVYNEVTSEPTMM